MFFTRKDTKTGATKHNNLYGGVGALPQATARAISRRTVGSQGSPIQEKQITKGVMTKNNTMPLHSRNLIPIPFDHFLRQQPLQPKRSQCYLYNHQKIGIFLICCPKTYFLLDLFCYQAY